MALRLQGTYAGVELWFDVVGDTVEALRVVNPTTRTVRLQVSRGSGANPLPARDIPPGTDDTVSLPGNRRYSWATNPTWVVDAWPL